MNKSEEDIDGIKIRLERLLNLFSSLDESYSSLVNFEEITDNVCALLAKLTRYETDKNPHGFITKLEPNGRGAPKLCITKQQLQFYLDNGFKTTQISEMINVSKSTVKRRLQEYNLNISDTYSCIDDDELDKTVESFLKDFPNTGYKRMKGFLTSINLKIQEERVRCAMRRVDPEGVILRTLQSRPVLRRTYKVAGPLSLWHMDGNHKLIA